MRTPIRLTRTPGGSGEAARSDALMRAVPDEGTRYDQEFVLHLLRECGANGATDLHLKVPGRPRMRIEGALMATEYPPLTPDATFQLAQALLDLAGKELPLATLTDQEMGFGVARVGRFHARLYRQRGSLGIIIHRMALEVPTIADLGGTPAIARLTWAKPGLTLVTSTSRRMALLAALIHEYNSAVSGHLVSLEQPMEFLHRDDKASIAQREVGVDTPTYVDGLHAVLVGDCDAVVVTSVTDADAAEHLLRIAESGRRAVAGISGCPPEEAARWLVRMFPPHREREIAERVAHALKGVVHYDGKTTTALSVEGLKLQ